MILKTYIVMGSFCVFHLYRAMTEPVMRFGITAQLRNLIRKPGKTLSMPPPSSL